MTENTEPTPKERRLANLKPPWKPGESGNPAGRPEGAKNTIRSCLYHALQKQIVPNIETALKQEGIELEENTNAEGIANVLINQSLHGDIQSTKIISDLTEEPFPKDVKVTHGGAVVLINAIEKAQARRDE